MEALLIIVSQMAVFLLNVVCFCDETTATLLGFLKIGQVQVSESEMIMEPECRCQAKFLTYHCLSVIFSQSKEMKFGDYFFRVCCVNSNFMVRYQITTTIGGSRNFFRWGSRTISS